MEYWWVGGWGFIPPPAGLPILISSWCLDAPGCIGCARMHQHNEGCTAAPLACPSHQSLTPPPPKPIGTFGNWGKFGLFRCDSVYIEFSNLPMSVSQCSDPDNEMIDPQTFTPKVKTFPPKISSHPQVIRISPKLIFTSKYVNSHAFFYCTAKKK